MGTTSLEAIDSELSNRTQIIQSLKENLKKAQSHMKNQADQKRKEFTFNIGDQVLLRLRPYRQLTVARRSSQKLAPRFFGPFEVLERVGSVAYRLLLPPEARIHPVFHVSLLRPFHPSLSYKVHHLPCSNETHPSHDPLAIISRRTIWRRGRSIPQVLVQWTNLPPEAATWEDEATVSLSAGAEDEEQGWRKTGGRKEYLVRKDRPTLGEDNIVGRAIILNKANDTPEHTSVENRKKVFDILHKTKSLDLPHLIHNSGSVMGESHERLGKWESNKANTAIEDCSEASCSPATPRPNASLPATTHMGSDTPTVPSNPNDAIRAVAEDGRERVTTVDQGPYAAPSRSTCNIEDNVSLHGPADVTLQPNASRPRREPNQPRRLQDYHMG